MSSTDTVTADAFLQCVLRSQLLGRDELQDALRAVPKPQRNDPVALAEHLVHVGKLTRYQTGKLLRGIALGMVVGPFRLLGPVGRGGMATVFLVRDTRSGGLAALKVLPPKLARTEARMVARFKREMEMAVKLTHPHLVWAYDVGEYRGVHYIAMEYVAGRTLSKLVAESGPLDPAFAARLFAEVASALDHAHQHGLIHRDLKPSNIMVTPRGHAKVVDFGLALMHGEKVEDSQVVGGKGYIVGTMDYIAPEQTADAAAVGPRCDLYSLGCTLYFALSGRPPFPGGTSKEKIARHRTEMPTPLRELRPGLPEGLAAVVESLMSKDPDGRPANAADAARALKEWAREPDELDEPEVVSFDEEALRAGSALSEYSMTSLPEVELAEEEPPASGRPWALLLWLALPVGIMIAVAAWLASRR